MTHVLGNMEIRLSADAKLTTGLFISFLHYITSFEMYFCKAHLKKSETVHPWYIFEIIYSHGLSSIQSSGSGEGWHTTFGQEFSIATLQVDAQSTPEVAGRCRNI